MFSILILDREKSFYPLPRAVHFDDEIMRVFQTIGITDTLSKKLIITPLTTHIPLKKVANIFHNYKIIL